MSEYMSSFFKQRDSCRRINGQIHFLNWGWLLQASYFLNWGKSGKIMRIKLEVHKPNAKNLFWKQGKKRLIQQESDKYTCSDAKYYGFSIVSMIYPNKQQYGRGTDYYGFFRIWNTVSKTLISPAKMK